MRAAGAPEKTVFRGTWFDLGDVVRGEGWGGGVFGWAWGHETLIPRILGTGALCRSNRPWLKVGICGRYSAQPTTAIQ